MKTGSLNTATRIIGLTSLLLLVSVLAYGWAGASNPPEWVNFFSANTAFLGQPVQVGDVILAFDPQGVQMQPVHCHHRRQIGLFGLLSRRGNDA